jgi:hypothetical protein
MAAALGVIALLWVISVPVQRLLRGPRVEAAISVETHTTLPPGIPAGATNVPVVLLLDGGEIRQGDLATKLDEIVPVKYATGPVYVSRGEFGDRRTRGYLVNGARFFVVCERSAPLAPMRIAAIYLP